MKSMVKVLVAAALVLAFAAPASAQATRSESRGTLGVGLSFLDWMEYDSWAKGFAVDFAKPVGDRRMSIVGDFSWGKDNDETDITLGGGVRWAFPNTGRATVYAQGTVGMARWSIDGESNSGIFFAPAFGVIVPVTARVGVKGQIDFYLVKWNDDFDDGNLVRYFIGIAIDMNR